jgi:hypothetical protein
MRAILIAGIAFYGYRIEGVWATLAIYEMILSFTGLACLSRVFSFPGFEVFFIGFTMWTVEFGHMDTAYHTALSVQ